MADNPTPKVGGKKLPKQFWIIGIGAALIIGLYLRSRSSSQAATSSQASSTPTDVTSSPYTYTAGGAYPDLVDQYGSSPYGVSSLLGNSGLPNGFDPTSFEEGITYDQQNLGGGQALTLPASSAAIPTPTAGGGIPGAITVNLGAITAGKTSGKPIQSARKVVVKHTTPKPHHSIVKPKTKSKKVKK